MLIDTHCHLDLPPLKERLAELLEQARLAGVGQWVVPGIAPDGWSGIADLCCRMEGLRPAFGIHPAFATAVGEEQFEALEAYAGQAVAIGEIGLDSEIADDVAQELVLRRQIRIARRFDLPLLLHCRGRVGRLLSILQEEQAGQVGGIMHSFSGSFQSAREFIRAGFAISLSGTLTWDAAQRPLKLAGELPLEHLVIETDAPYLTPQRYRGHSNQPAWIIEQLDRLAAIRGISVQELSMVLAANAQRYLRMV